MERRPKHDRRKKRKKERDTDHGQAYRPCTASAPHYDRGCPFRSPGILCAIFLTILAGQGILKGLGENTFSEHFTAGNLFLLMGILAVLRGFSIMRSSTATTLLLLNFWPSSAIRYLPLLESFVRQSWREEIKEILFPLLPQILNCWKSFMPIPFLPLPLPF